MIVPDVLPVHITTKKNSLTEHVQNMIERHGTTDQLVRIMKYHNFKFTTSDGNFDSRREYDRWCELKLLQRAKEISGLKRQVRYELIPAQKINGKVVERKCEYIADFVYQDKYGNTVVEDAKGFKTKDYIIKRKLMLHRYGIHIREV